MESKKLVLDQLETFIDKSECRINAILHSLGWSKESVLNSNATQQHTNDPGKVKLQRNNHVETFPPSFYPTGSASSIRLDNIKQAEAILEEVYQNPSLELGVPLEQLADREPPSSIADLHVNFTREERLSICRHVLNNTAKPADAPEIKIRFKRDVHSEEKVTSLPEIAAIERDARRRNPKYRGSRNPLTYSEELRHLIQVQTDALAHHLRHSSHAVGKDEEKTTQRNYSKRGRKSPEPYRGDGSRKMKSNHVRRSRSITPDHRKRTRHYRSRSRERSSSKERKRHKSHKKHNKKHDR